ncbi:hypothetical protein B9Z19DRAFT_1069785 [Tuber borchii]|uniref:Uncharacterized protein n=1 Tax=Tuber borchii TaxID=42251 RepID=A0A2T6ZA82_TUBBO|nr:hypothetical protein B9Z19DRAFT_1069785 [Tuber borchii]
MTEPEKIISTVEEAQAWQMPFLGEYVSDWKITGVSKTKNHVIGFIFQRLEILLPTTISWLDESPKDFNWIIDPESEKGWRGWWQTILRNKNVSNRKGKTLRAWAIGDYKLFQKGIYFNWLRVELKNTSSNKSLIGENIMEDTEEEIAKNNTNLKGGIREENQEENMEYSMEEDISIQEIDADHHNKLRSQPSLSSECSQKAKFSHNSPGLQFSEYESQNEQNEEFRICEEIPEDKWQLRLKESEENSSKGRRYLLPDTSQDNIASMELSEVYLRNQVRTIKSGIKTMQALSSDTMLKLYLEQTNSILISQNEYEKEEEEKDQAIADREILGRVLTEGVETMNKYSEEERELMEKIRILEEERGAIIEARMILEEKRLRIEEKEKIFENLIEKANQFVK